MKKFLSVFLCIIMAGMLTVPAFADNLSGDSDGDGTVSVSDARLALRVSVQLDECDPASVEFERMDTDGDGEITVSDARFILRVAVGLEKTGKDLTSSEIYKLAEAFTVEISTEGPGFTGTGSGFFIDGNGTVATNFHVIENSVSLKVTDCNGDVWDVTEIVAYDEDIDIAIIRTNATNTSYATISSVYATGDKIYTLGSALGLSYTFSSGMISQAKREIEEYNTGVYYIQIDAPISSGNSGGPLLDEKGNVIGLNTLGYNDGQNLNFAVPASYLNTLDRSNPISAEDYYYSNEHGVYAAALELKKLCYTNGYSGTDSDGDTYYEISGSGLTQAASLIYYPDYDLLGVTYSKQSGMMWNYVLYYDALYIDSSDEYTCVALCEKNSGTVFQANYTVDGSTFKSGSSVSYTGITTGNASDSATYAKQSASNVVSMVSFLNSVIKAYGLSITVKDLGFANF